MSKTGQLSGKTCLIAFFGRRLSPAKRAASFRIADWTVYVIFIVVIGGIGGFEGPIIAAIVFLPIRQYLAEIGVWHFIPLGVLSIAAILIEPRGLCGLCFAGSFPRTSSPSRVPRQNNDEPKRRTSRARPH
ncbi:MAG: hypothetical protein ABSA66_17860 [Roseiarcus sp.]|jgi:branched-chain amino acid transport system permease protein